MTRLPFWRREVSESKSKSVSFSSAKKKKSKAAVEQARRWRVLVEGKELVHGRDG